MNESRPPLSTDIEEIGAMVDKSMDQSPTRIASSRMHDQTRRFIEHDAVLVLVKDIERESFRL
jgi:hypothetical protein